MTMQEGVRMHAVTVNDHTSHFVELMVRTLLLTNTFHSLDWTLRVQHVPVPVVCGNDVRSSYSRLPASSTSVSFPVGSPGSARSMQRRPHDLRRPWPHLLAPTRPYRRGVAL